MSRAELYVFLDGSDLFHDEALDDVADLDVVELLDLHAAFTVAVRVI